MSPIQEKLLDVARLNDIEKIRNVDLVKLVGCKYSSQIAHHMNQLIKRGDLVRRNNRLVPSTASKSGLIRVPVMGEADCGEATKYADGRIDHYLMLSPSLISSARDDNIYALVARGDSMNRANIKGKEIHNGDYVIVEKREGYTPDKNDIVVSIIGGLATIKRYRYDELNGRILLQPDSHRQNDFAPIIISENDDFQVEGKVVDVVKAVD